LEAESEVEARLPEIDGAMQLLETRIGHHPIEMLALGRSYLILRPQRWD
jgi:hypothetical protein